MTCGLKAIPYVDIEQDVIEGQLTYCRWSEDLAAILYGLCEVLLLHSAPQSVQYLL